MANYKSSSYFCLDLFLSHDSIVFPDSLRFFSLFFVVVLCFFKFQLRGRAVTLVKLVTAAATLLKELADDTSFVSSVSGQLKESLETASASNFCFD